MASEEFKARCLKHLDIMKSVARVYNPPGISTSVLFADYADVCIIGTQFSSDLTGRPYGKDDVRILRPENKDDVVLLTREGRGSSRMLPKTVTPDGEHLTITVDDREESYVISDLLQQPAWVR